MEKVVKSAKQVKKENLELKAKIEKLSKMIIFRGNEYSKLMGIVRRKKDSSKTKRKVCHAWAKDSRKSIMALRKRIYLIEKRMG